MTIRKQSLSDCTKSWFRTRWATLWWPFRSMFAVIIVFAAATGNWLILLSLPGWFFIIADWQYWVRRGEIATPIANFGAKMAAALYEAEQRGQREVAIRIEAGEWVMVSDA